MFGYVIADLGRLTEAQRLRYHSVYCGLCRALKLNTALRRGFWR